MSAPLLHDKEIGSILSDNKYLPALIGIMALFIAIGGYGIYSVKQEIEDNLVDQLELTLAGNVESLRLFFEDKKLDAQVLADQPAIRKNILSLIKITKKEDVSAEKLQQSASLKWLREHLGKACKKYGFIGFVIFDPTGLQVGALLEEPVGKRVLIERSVFFYQALQGDTVVSNPFIAVAKLPDEQGEFHANQPTQFVSTPLKDQDGNVLGVLAFRMRPHKEFHKILTISRFGKTGESYAFNDDGLLVSNSRFDEQLVNTGLLPPGKASIFNIQIRDPGRDLKKKPLLPNESVENWPLTFMAENAVMKKAGVNVEGYNDYRGIPVIGAWTWMEDQMLGIDTEINTDEAFAPLNTLLFWYMTLLGLLVISMVVGLFLRSRILKTRKQTLENQKRLSSLTGIIFDSVVAIDQKGIVQSINPAVEKVFGFSPKEVIGKNVKILMPDPFFSEHDSYLDNYLRTGEKKIINMVREVRGLHKNGSTFPMELSVSESTENDQKIFVGVLRDISERKANELAMEVVNRERNLILNSAGEGIYGLDLEGNTTFVNPTACKLLGYSEEELLGKGQHILVHHSYPDGTHYPKDKCPIYSTFRDGKDRQEDEEVFWKKDGSSFPVEYISKPIIDGGKVVGAVVTFTDITARKNAEKELQHAYNELEKRIQERTHELNKAKEMAEHHNQTKSEFLSRMSHELRTPMNAILGFAQIMNESRKDPLSDSHKSRISQILKAGNHLLELINEVLDLARVEAGKITVSLEPINIAELAIDVLNVVRPMAEKFDIRLIDGITAQNSVHIFADKTRLKQVLFNLLSNGIKYNRKEGSVTLSLKKQKDGTINILVTDTGMGIPPEKLEKIFVPFDRLGAEGGEVEGTGIGMTISKKLIELMNGRINVHSTIGKGSQFSVSLPSCDPKKIDKKYKFLPLESPSSETSKQKITVLYIEDNKTNVLLVQDILSDFPEVNILVAPQAALGLDLAYAHQPDLILLDINLPGMNGFEALKRLQNMEETHNIPVIALSANAMQKDIDRAKEAGFKDYITKPIDISKLKNKINEYLLAKKLSENLLAKHNQKSFK
ncbi:MAG: PAS domain S-box protein [Nitrospinaceae bacterium]|nr:PAS domain S-box protein [Nitrospinaceae bacterium]